MYHANVIRVERSCEALRQAMEAVIAVLGNSECNPALYEHMKATCHGMTEENDIAVQALVEWASTRATTD